MTEKRRIILVDITDKCPLDCKYCFSTKTNTTMNRNQMIDTAKYIENFVKQSPNDHYAVCISGGEPGLVDPIQTYEFIIDLKNRLKGYRVEWLFITSLIYKLKPEHKKLFNEFEIITLTYDYDIRYTNVRQRRLWLDNLHEVQCDCTCVPNLSVLLTSGLVKNVSPLAFLDLLMSWDIHFCEFYRVFLNNQKMKNISIKAMNADANEWMYQFYKLWIKLKPSDFQLSIETFKSIEEAVQGNRYYEYTRDCVAGNIHIHVDGEVNQCPAGNMKGYDNIFFPNPNKEQDRMIRVYEEKNFHHPECLACSNYKYCGGGCYNWIWDKSGCPTPKKIFELAEIRYESM